MNKQNWIIEWDAQPLGKMSDADLAKRLGCARFSVFSARKVRGIPSFTGPGRPSQYDWNSLPLGEMTDVDLAAQIGAKASTVYAARSRRRIKSFTEQQRDAAATTATTNPSEG